MSRKLQRKQIDIDLSEGRTGSSGSDDYGTINVSKLDDSDKMEDAFHKLEVIIDKLAPATPPFLNSADLSLDYVGYSTNPNGYVSSALIADGIGGIANNVMRLDTSYIFNIEGYPSGENPANNGYSFDADSGVLTGVLDLDPNSTASITFTTADDSGSSVSLDAVLTLEVLSEKDYFLGEIGKEGFWNAFNSRIILDPSLTISLDPSQVQHTLEMTHDITGSQLNQFYIEDATFPALSALSAQSNMTERVSGVPTLSTSDNIFAFFTATNAIKNFYRDDIVTISGDSLTTSNFVISTDIGTIPAAFDIITSNKEVNANPLSFRDTNVVIDIDARDAFNNETSQIITLSDKRIDTKSIAIAANDIGSRISANSNEPVTSLGSGLASSPYDHAVFLTETAGNYNLQLQVLDGVYTYPIANNYSTYDYFNGSTNSAGPDYSSGIIEAKRWASFEYEMVTPTTLTQALNISILNNNGITTANQLSGRCDLYYKVITWSGSHGGTVLSETAWVQAVGNLNAATFNGGDGFMVGNDGQDETSIYSSTVDGAHIGTINENTRVVTVGNNITGTGTSVTVHVRVSIAIGESFTFSGLNVSI